MSEHDDHADVITLEGRISSHEEVCAVRYEGINKSIDKMDGKLDKLDAKLESNTQSLKVTINKYVITTLGFLIVTLLTVSGYLYTELNKRTGYRPQAPTSIERPIR